MGNQVRIADRYVEVRFFGEIEPGTFAGARLTEEEIAAIRRAGCVLFDFSEIDSFGFDAERLGQAMQRLGAQGIRLAVHSSNPLFFGVGRQIALYSGLEGEAIAVFDKRVEALGWLLGAEE